MGSCVRRVAFVVVSLVAVACFSLQSPFAVRAATPITDCDHFIGQGGKTGLSDALATAASGDTLLFSCGGSLATAHTVPVTSHIVLHTILTIDGGGYAVTLDGSTVSPTPTDGGIIQLNGGTLTLTRLTLANGSATQTGGAITINGVGTTVNLTGATLAGNTAGTTAFGEAGAIEVNGGTLNATNSTFVNNRALDQFGDGSDGGAITLRNGSGTVASRIANCTFTDNQVTGSFSEGGAIAAILGAAFPVITNALFVRNAANQGPNIIGTLDPTSDYNLADNGSGGAFGHAHDIVTATPQVGTLGSNGGPTQTVPLLVGSPAINAGAPVGGSVPNTDQRGVPRPQGTGVDIGAYEFVAAYSTLVNTTADDGSADITRCVPNNANTCRLRDAIAVVNANLASGTTITFAIAGTGTKTITVLGNALPALAQSMTIDGATQPGWPTTSSIVVDGNSQGSVFAVNSGVTVTLNGLTIQHGSGTAISPFTLGGGILNDGTLTVTNSTIANNSISGSNAYGGGVINRSTLTVTNSTFSGNSAGGGGGNGGGIFNERFSTTTVTNSTLSGNSAGNGGGGIYSYGTVLVTNSTLSGNSAGTGNGGGISNSSGDNNTITLTNTIVANSPTGGDLVVKGGPFIGKNNLIDDAASAGGFTDNDANHNIVGHPANLGLLGTYGSTNGTQTFSLLPGSPALDAGDDPTCALTGTGKVNNLDQRGITRPQPAGGHCDIGAFEARFTLTLTGGDNQSALITQPFANPLVVTFGGPDAPADKSGAAVTFTAPLSGASATFIPNPATTNASGVASVTATANATAGGPYNVTASTPGAAGVTFHLTNFAVSLVVNNNGDGLATPGNCATGNANTCRLRDAIAAVNGGVTPTTITFAQDMTITLQAAQGTPTLTANQTIDGTGHTVVVDGNHAVTVFTVNGGVTATLNALTIQHGIASATNGGGILNAGALTVMNSIVSANSVPNHGGGGIFNTGTLMVTNATFSANNAATGGGIYNNGGTLSVTGSTFSANVAPNAGGGITLNGGTLTVTNSTFSGNTAANAGGGGIVVGVGAATVTNSTFSGNGANSGGGIFNQGTVTLTNTLVANSTSGGDLNGTIGGNNNLIDDTSAITGTGNLTNTPALLGTLGNYGGPTQTIPLLPGSPAIDAGVTGGTVPATDQRGKPRVGAPDIGAFESQGFTLAMVSGDGQSAVTTTAFATRLVVMLTPKSAGEPVAGGVVTFTVTPNAGAQATFGALAGCTLSNGNLTARCPVDGTGKATSPTLTANGTAGAYTATASAAGVTLPFTFHLTNTARTLVSITVAPANVTLKVGQSQTFTAMATYTDNSTADVTGAVTWTSDTPAVATVDASGKATGQIGGTAHLTAKQGSVTSNTATVTVSAPTGTGITINPVPSGRPSGTTSEPAGTPAPAPSPAPAPTGGGATGGAAPASAPVGR